MKTIIVFRHGKSDWDADYGDDHDRPLARRGVRAAKRMGRFLAAVGGIPDLVVSSTALRALSTARRAAESGGWDCEIRESSALYEASPQTLIDFVRDVTDRVQTLMLVGHEPASSALIQRLAGASVVFPTAAMARLDFEGDTWADVATGRAQLIWLVIPKAVPRSV